METVITCGAESTQHTNLFKTVIRSDERREIGELNVSYGSPHRFQMKHYQNSKINNTGDRRVLNRIV